MARLFALDQNFPEPIVDALQAHLEDDVELVPIRRVNGRMSELDDWQVLLALHQDGRAWDGLVNTDSDMLSLPRELTVLCQTRLTLVVAVAAGHDQIKATGLVLAHVAGICNQTRRDAPQVWRLATSQRAADNPWEYLSTVAARRGETADALYRRERLTKAQLSRSPL